MAVKQEPLTGTMNDTSAYPVREGILKFLMKIALEGSQIILACS